MLATEMSDSFEGVADTVDGVERHCSIGCRLAGVGSCAVLVGGSYRLFATVIVIEAACGAGLNDVVVTVRFDKF